MYMCSLLAPIVEAVLAICMDMIVAIVVTVSLVVGSCSLALPSGIMHASLTSQTAFTSALGVSHHQHAEKDSGCALLEFG
jgi:hypothetical protein